MNCILATRLARKAVGCGGRRWIPAVAVAALAALLWCPAAQGQPVEAGAAPASGEVAEVAVEEPAVVDAAGAEAAGAAAGAGVEGESGEAAADAGERKVPIACSITRIKGTVEWRPSEQAPWQRAAEGDALSNGSDIRTGFRAVCSLVFSEASSVVQLEPLTVMRIGEFEHLADGRVRTRLYLKQGATRSIVEKSRLETDFAIITPQVTLAVQGTKVIHASHRSDFGTRIGLSNSGRIHVTNRQTGRGRQLQPGDSVTQQMLLAIETAQFSKAVPIFDQFGGVTQNEQYSILRGPQVFTGVGVQSGTGGGTLSGTSNTFNESEFWQQYMEYLMLYEQWMQWLRDNYPDFPDGEYETGYEW